MLLSTVIPELNQQRIPVIVPHKSVIKLRHSLGNTKGRELVDSRPFMFHLVAFEKMLIRLAGWIGSYLTT